MYNMDISIFGYKLNLEVLILIGVVYLILVGHTFCGCSSFGIMEGMESKTSVENDNLDTQESAGSQNDSSTPEAAAPGMMGKSGKDSKSVEGFVGANTNYGESSSYDLTSNVPVDTSSWGAPSMTVVPGQPLSPAVKTFMAREPQQVPLPEGEMLMFANTKFGPEFCPNTYSNSMGCPAMTGDQYNYLVTRGGNNVPYSEY